MMQTTAGIVLRTLKYKDTALLVDAYTESRGRATFQVPVPRRRQSGVRPSLFQPLMLVELEYEERPRTDLHRVTGARLLHPFVSLPFDPCKAAIALFLGEFLCRAIREELPHPALYAYLHHSICWLDACPQGYANFHLVFLMRLSRFLGLYPNLEDYVPGACFDLLNACFTPLPPQQHRFYLDADESSSLVTLMRMNYDTMHLFALNRQERGRCLTVLNDYYRLHLPNFPVLKSLEVLKELFD